MWDALVEACRRLQATDTLPHAHGTTARLTVTMPLDELRDHLDAQGLLPSQETLSAAVARRLACDAEIIPAVLGTEGQVLDVGRTARLVTTGIWTALVLRDQHCAFPGCSRLPIACDAHHIIHWTDGGPTSLDNLSCSAGNTTRSSIRHRGKSRSTRERDDRSGSHRHPSTTAPGSPTHRPRPRPPLVA